MPERRDFKKNKVDYSDFPSLNPRVATGLAPNYVAIVVVLPVRCLILRHDANHGTTNKIQNLINGCLWESGQARYEGNGLLDHGVSGYKIHEGSNLRSMKFHFPTVIGFLPKCCQSTGGRVD